MGEGNIYRGSDGRYYGDVDIWERFESGAWTPCVWDTESGVEWVETEDEELLSLVPLSERPSSDPSVEQICGGLRVVSGRPENR
ncbi:hypothetical protein SAMN04487948_105378 [Halogranum amylolyticum]|uniref:Uncharacterized protein n=1 Tax=Halogranum amylolyticum TaxID=660520 RepID=A0A1H8SW62_9EURY|nr:hypothetical protein [Halogranum amylolyticum]SEO83229.1 hypothetical protein SAMN04487948_105378 [Halogranum amylolyticum]